jgi:multidrug efflux pump subunit AcrA (membrane-fusion protein)
VVYRKKPEGGFEPVPVTLGPSGMGKVVIESGLAAGDRVALVDPTRSRDDAAGKGPEDKGAATPAGPPQMGPLS